MIFLPDSNNFGLYIKRIRDFQVQPQRVYFIWGLGEQDIDECHQTDFDCVGETVFDDTFVLESINAQQSMLVRNTVASIPSKLCGY